METGVVGLQSTLLIILPADHARATKGGAKGSSEALDLRLRGHKHVYFLIRWISTHSDMDAFQGFEQPDLCIMELPDV